MWRGVWNVEGEREGEKEGEDDVDAGVEERVQVEVDVEVDVAAVLLGVLAHQPGRGLSKPGAFAASERCSICALNWGEGCLAFALLPFDLLLR